MGFRQELDEKHEEEQKSIQDRKLKVKIIRDFYKNKDVDIEREIDQILYPEDYDDFGHRRYFAG